MSNPYAAQLLAWYTAHARDLPWRRPSASPWSVYVSEIMLQQTPVARVLPAHAAWLDRWPTPAALASEQPSEAIRAWGNLGYPRRALRLHATARIVVSEFGGNLPGSVLELSRLPGAGSYTAAAVAAFAFSERVPVLDTNARRVLARLVGGAEHPPPAITAAQRRLAGSLLPADGRRAARWSVAVMELGALVCTAAKPHCEDCPLAARCAWRRAGWPRGPGRPRGQPYHGTDRQCRGVILAALRETDGPVPLTSLDVLWPDAAQRARALASLVVDGLAEHRPGGRFALPDGRATVIGESSGQI
jgi:A/G-specific adenine glycosylase